MASVGIKELLESGVHFGHQTRRWNPKMRRYIFGERGGIYIIDLLKTERLLDNAQQFAAGVARRGGTILFVGTKKQARDAIKETAEACGMPYVNHRWLGGLLTNFQTISLRIKRLHDLERFQSEGQLELLPTQERMSALSDLEKLQANLGGVKFMQRPPDAVFVVDLKTEAIAVREAQRLRIPIIGLVDTNCDPDGIDYVIPGNDDAIRSCSVVLGAVGQTILENRAVWQRAEEDRIKREAEEAARRAAEEAARRAAEEEARRQAEVEAAERVEENQADAAATPKAREPIEGGRNQPRAAGRPQPAPTVTEDLPRGAAPRGKRRKAQTGAIEDLEGARQAGQMPDEGALAPAKAASPVAPAAAAETAAAVEAAPGATESDPGSAEKPAEEAQAAAGAVVEADEKAAAAEEAPAGAPAAAGGAEAPAAAPEGKAAAAAEEAPAEKKPARKPAARKPAAKKPAAKKAAPKKAEKDAEEPAAADTDEKK